MLDFKLCIIPFTVPSYIHPPTLTCEEEWIFLFYYGSPQV